jgi:hypothetical protein
MILGKEKRLFYGGGIPPSGADDPSIRRIGRIRPIRLLFKQVQHRQHISPVGSSKDALVEIKDHGLPLLGSGGIFRRLRGLD